LKRLNGELNSLDGDNMFREFRRVVGSQNSRKVAETLLV